MLNAARSSASLAAYSASWPNRLRRATATAAQARPRQPRWFSENPCVPSFTPALVFSYLLNPGIPLTKELLGFFRILIRQIHGFRAVFFQVIKLPIALAGFHQLPVPVPDRMVPLVRPPKRPLAATIRVERGNQTASRERNGLFRRRDARQFRQPTP